MNWPDAEAAIVSHIQTQWAASAFAAVDLVFDNENAQPPERFMYVSIEGTFSEKTIYGSVGHRSSVEYGIVFYHAFIPRAEGKTTALEMAQTMAEILELQVLDDDIRLDGAAPPSPVEYDTRTTDRGLPTAQPDGNYYRCTSSVPFIVIDVR